MRGGRAVLEGHLDGAGGHRARPSPHDRGGLQPPAGRVPRHLDLEDPLPRGPGAPGPAADAGRLPPLHRGRRRAPADDPAAPARRVPAAPGHPPGARGRRAARPARRPAPPACRCPRTRSTSARSASAPASTRAFVRELEEYGLVEPRTIDGEKRFPERDVDVAAACARLARYGVAPRNLATFRRWADNEADLLERIVAPELRSANPEKRHAGLENLETLAALSQELSQPALLAGAARYRASVVTPSTSLRRSGTSRTSPSAASSSRTSCRSSPTRRRCTRPSSAWREFAEPREPDLVLGAEARGFILGAALAYRLGCGFVAARKPGKLPWRTISAKYALEYGFDALELHADAIKPRSAGPDPRRPPGDRRHRQGQDRPRGAARRHRRRPRVRDRARVPERPREARRLRRLLAHPVLGLNHRCGGASSMPIHNPESRCTTSSPGATPSRARREARSESRSRASAFSSACSVRRARRLQGHVRMRLRRRARRARHPRRARLGAARGRGLRPSST